MHHLKNRKKKDQDNYVKFRSFVGYKLTSFPPIPPTSKIEEINISNNNLTSFKGLIELQNLETLRCENTKISSFLGAKPLPSLKKLFIANTPLSHYAYHRVMAVIVFGDSLETVDFVNITKTERLFAINNRELLFQFLVEGWVMTITDPIKLFNVNTRQRRVLFPAPVFASPSNSPVKSPTKSRHLTPTSSPQKQSYSPIQSKPVDISETRTILLLMRRLHLILFEKTGSKSIYRRPDDDFLTDDDQKQKQNDEIVTSIEPLLINEEAYYIFVKMFLMAVNTRSLNIKEVVEFFSLFKNEKAISCLKDLIPKFTFYSYPILADLLENLLDQNILNDDDIKPYFFSVYERFENWNSTFVLFESNSNLSVSFISFFCIFSNIINRVDNELYNNLQNQLGDTEKDTYESFMKIHETRPSTIKTLLSDDIVSYASLSESNIIQNVIDYTPWSITTNVKSAAAAFAGSDYCFLQYSIKGENFNVLFKTEDQENSEDEDVQKQNLIDIKNEDEVLFFAVAGGNNNIILKFKHNDSDALIDYIPTAVQYHRFTSLNQIFIRVTNSKYMKFDDNFLEIDDDDDLIQEEEDQEDKNSSSLSKFSRYYIPAAENLDYCALMYLARKKVPFENSVLNTIISKSVSNGQSKNDVLHSNSFLVHFLLNLGFRTDDCLFLAVQKQNIEIAKVIINRFDSRKYDIITDETKVVRFRAQEKRNIMKIIGNFKGDDNLHWTPIHVATCMGDLNLVKLLALREEINVNEQDDDGNTALTIAVSNELTDIVKFLSSLTIVDPNLADKKGWTPLAIATGNNYVDIVSILLDNSRTNVNCKTIDEGATPLMIAVDTDNFEAFKELLTRDDINVNAVSKNHKTALSIAIENERLIFINALVETNKIDIKAGNSIQLINQSKNDDIKVIFKKYL